MSRVCDWPDCMMIVLLAFLYIGDLLAVLSL